MIHLWNDSEKRKMSQCHILHQLSGTYWSGIENGPPQWEAQHLLFSFLSASAAYIRYFVIVLYVYFNLHTVGTSEDFPRITEPRASGCSVSVAQWFPASSQMIALYKHAVQFSDPILARSRLKYRREIFKTKPQKFKTSTTIKNSYAFLSVTALPAVTDGGWVFILLQVQNKHWQTLHKRRAYRSHHHTFILPDVYFVICRYALLGKKIMMKINSFFLSFFLYIILYVTFNFFSPFWHIYFPSLSLST